MQIKKVDRWVRAVFLGIFLALGFSRFDGESRPSHLSLTRAVMRGFEGVYHSEESRSWVRNSPLALLRDTQNRVRSVAILERSTT